jgi:hypothetical protein
VLRLLRTASLLAALAGCAGASPRPDPDAIFAEIQVHEATIAHALSTLREGSQEASDPCREAAEACRAADALCELAEGLADADARARCRRARADCEAARGRVAECGRELTDG